MRKYTLPAIIAALLLTGTSAFTPAALPTSTNLTGTSAFAPSEYEVIDTYARRTPEANARSLKALSSYLTAPARTEFAKVRSIYAWIMSHVRYDYSTYTGALYASEAGYVSRILQSRRAVCTGFSLLFKHMLLEAGVNAVTVKGYSRYTDSQAGVPTGPLDHEWNAVEIDGDWYLFDLTWASTTAQHGKPNDFYFLTDPQAFVSQHYPADPRWQLLARPVSKADFDRFPKYYDAYFQLGFTEYFIKQGLLRAHDGVTLNFTNNENVEFYCALGPRGGRSYTQVPHQVNRDGDTYQVRVRVPNSGAQTLYVFAKQRAGRNERYKQYSAIASFTVM